MGNIDYTIYKARERFYIHMLLYKGVYKKEYQQLTAKILGKLDG